MAFCFSLLPCFARPNGTEVPGSIPVADELRPGRELRAVAGVDVDVFLGEITSPDARGAAPVVQIDDDRNVLFEEAAVCGALVERQRDRAGRALWRAVHFHSAEPDFRVVGIEWHARPARGGEDSAPVWIGACNGRFDKRGEGNGFGNLLCCRVA